jgi:hypothetical protein
MTGWVDLPWSDLPASVRIDVLGILAYGKPAIRIPICDNTIASRLAAAITAVGWSHARDDEYLVAAPTAALARHILNIDSSTQPHTLELGVLLGYPECCARAAAHAGEDNIDSHALRLGADCDREGVPYLDPRGYSMGVALVPYVACAPRCPQALHHAHAAQLHIAAATTRTEAREPWRTWRRTLDTIPGPPWRPA